MENLEKTIKEKIVYYKLKVVEIEESINKLDKYSKGWISEIDNLRLMKAKLEILEWLVN